MFGKPEIALASCSMVGFRLSSLQGDKPNAFSESPHKDSELEAQPEPQTSKLGYPCTPAIIVIGAKG